MSKLPGEDVGASALTTEELDRGLFTSSGFTEAGGSAEASDRAGVGREASFIEGWLVALIALAAAALAARAVARRTG